MPPGGLQWLPVMKTTLKNWLQDLKHIVLRSG